MTKKALAYFFNILIILFVIALLLPKTTNAEILFQDNFNDGNANGWIVERNIQWSNQSQPCYNNGQPANWKVVDGKYGIIINGPSCTTETMPIDELWNSSWNNYVFESDISFIIGLDANIAFRYSGRPNFDWYGYHFLIQDTPSNSSIILQRVYNTDIYPNVANYYLEHGQTYYIKIIVNGEYIKIFINNVLVLDYPDAGGRFPTGRIALQASVGAISFSEVWFDNIVVTSIDEELEEIIPIVMLPGLGGSWNALALITGKDIGNWEKVPFVKVYDNLKNTLIDNAGYIENDDYFEFYYDWRKPLSDLADEFKDYLENTVLVDKPSDIKVNLVGHSMGGMVARAYGQKYGKDKINKIATVGSPHEGAIKAWQSWSGAEVGDRWSWQWIALQLYLHMHRGKYTSPVSAIHNLSPSLNNLTPIFDFAKNQDNLVIDVITMYSFNNYLQGLKNTLTNNLKSIFHTIAGVDNETIEWIKLKDRNLADKLLGKWPDGKPDNYETTFEGDNTVLKKSSLINDTNQLWVANNHMELVQTIEGIEAILGVLEIEATPASSISSLPRNPALVFFLHSPANIRITAPDNSQAGYQVSSPMSNAVYSPDDKLLVIYNALDGEYQIEVMGSDTGSYDLNIGQLTELGEFWNTIEDDTSLNEVDLYSLNFNSQNPDKTPLIDQTGKTQLMLTRFKLKKLIEYINEQSFLKKNKKQLINNINRVIKMIDRALENINSKKYSIAWRYVRVSMADVYSLRMKVDKLSRSETVNDSIRTYIKYEINEAGKLLIDGLISTFNQSGKFITRKMAERYIVSAEKINTKVEESLNNFSGENYFLGTTYELSQIALENAQFALSHSDYISSYANALVHRLLGLEIIKALK